MLAKWGVETGSLNASQRQTAVQVGRALLRGSSIKPQDAERAVEILDRATALGFSVESN